MACLSFMAVLALIDVAYLSGVVLGLFSFLDSGGSRC